MVRIGEKYEIRTESSERRCASSGETARREDASAGDGVLGGDAIFRAAGGRSGGARRESNHARG